MWMVCGPTARGRVWGSGTTGGPILAVLWLDTFPKYTSVFLEGKMVQTVTVVFREAKRD